MNNSNYSWAEYASREQLAAQLADDVAARLNASIAQRGRAVLAVSGGSTPKPFFIELSSRTVDWARVIVTLVDERWVDVSNELSNAALVKQTLLDELPATAQFVSLYSEAADVNTSLPTVLAAYCAATDSTPQQPAGFDVVVLGMGGDGHTASFFPDAENIAALVDLNSSDVLLTCNTPSSQVARVTWSLPMLLNTEMLALHFTGGDKKRVFARAVEHDDAIELPIRGAIFQQQTPLNVYYAD